MQEFSDKVMFISYALLLIIQNSFTHNGIVILMLIMVVSMIK